MTSIVLVAAILALAFGVLRAAQGSRPVPERSLERFMAAAPPGRWRMVPFDQLDRVVLWLSQIVVRHKESRPGDYCLRAVGWNPDESVPARSRAEARLLALQLAAGGSKEPSKFAALARRYSDDIVTRDHGGSLGGVRASQIGPQFLDVIQAATSSVTGVVETPCGFHVLHLRQPPSEQTVAGQRLVIRYRGTVNTEVYGLSSRSRSEAKTLAERLSQRTDVAFSRLVHEASESSDRARNGDLGVWSTQQPLYNGRELETLAELQPGAVSSPIDSPEGFEVLRRVEATPRPAYAITFVQVRYDPTSSGNGPGTKTRALEKAKAFADEVRKDPSRMFSLQKEHCCEEVLRWTLGRGDPALEPVVQALRVGEIAAEPVDIGWYYLIPKRLDPSTLAPEPPVRYDLPNPRELDMTPIFERASAQQLVEQVRGLRTAVADKLALPTGQQLVLDTALLHLETLFGSATTPADRQEARRQVYEVLRRDLNPEAFARFDRFRTAWLSSRLFGYGPSKSSP